MIISSSKGDREREAFLRNSANNVSFSLVRVFILQPVVLICLLAASGQAASDTGYDDSDVSDRLNHKPDLIPNGLFPLLDDPYLTILRAKSENPIKDESPHGEEELADKKKETIEPITRKLPVWGEKIREMGYDLPLPFGVGAMYMDYKQTVTDDINLNELDSRLPSVEIDFEIDVKNEEHWNFLFGGQWEITKRWQVMAEGGVGNRRHAILGAFFRF